MGSAKSEPILKKINRLIENAGLSVAEVAIIKKVALFSFISCLIVVGVVWGYYTLSIRSSTKQHSFADELPTLQSSLSLDIQAHLLIADSYNKRGNPEKAIPHLKRAYILSEKKPDIEFFLAASLIEVGNFQEALTHLEQLFEKQISDSLKQQLCVKTGITHYYLGEISQSVKNLNECVSQYPNSAEALCFLGRIESFSENTDQVKARTLFEKAIQIDSSSVETWYQLGRFEMTYGDSLIARKYMLQALELDPLHVKSHARLGMLYFYMGNYDLAQNCYRTTLALNPFDYNTRYNLGELLYTKGDTVEALREFTHTLNDKPDHVEANFKVGLISMRNNMYKEAVHSFESALSKEPSNIRILFQLAIAFEKIGLTSDAISTYKRILTIEELNPIAQQKIKLLPQGAIQ